MFRCPAIFILLWTTAFAAFAQGDRVLITTLNCYAFFGGNETRMQLGQPQTAPDYWRKAGNLVGLWPTNAPLLVALEEIGGEREADYLSRIAALRYKHSFLPIFTRTKDTFTGEAVGAVLDLDQGWKLAGKPGRDPDLDAALSKHLVVQLTNNGTTLELCVVHLRRGIGKYGLLAQRDQDEALNHWAKKRLAQNPRVNLIVLGDFNESKPAGDPAQSLAVLVATNGPLHDPFTLLSGGKIRTHANGKAYDRILLSDSIMKGAAGLKFENISVREHPYGKGTNRYWFSDHYPVTAAFSLPVKK